MMRQTSQPSLATIDGCGITAETVSGAVDQIIARSKRGDAFTVFTLNLDHLAKLRRSSAFRTAYQAADVITADGWPVAWMARRQAANIERTTGADLVVPLCERAAKDDQSIFLFGSTAAVLAKAGRDLAARTNGRLAIAGTLSPSTRFEPTGPEADAAIDMIVRSGANLCFVALGAPKQEVFAAYAKSKGVRCGFVCVGAALDFIAGAQIRAPKRVQAMGLEWGWRLASNPVRFARRYGECALVFADLLFVRPVRHRVRRGVLGARA